MLLLKAMQKHCLVFTERMNFIKHYLTIAKPYTLALWALAKVHSESPGLTVTRTEPDLFDFVEAVFGFDLGFGVASATSGVACSRLGVCFASPVDSGDA